MEFANSKSEFFDKITENISQLTKPQKFFYERVRVLIWIGYITGLYPVQNAICSKSAVPLRNKRLSLAYVYSFLLFVIKLLLICEMTRIASVYVQSEIGRFKPESETDRFAGKLAFASTFCSGILFHILSVCQLSRFLETLQGLDVYDEKYGDGETRCGVKEICMTKKSIAGFFTTILVMYTPIYMLYRIVPVVMERDPSFTIQLLPFVLSTGNAVLGLGFMTLCCMILELGTSFSYFQVFHVVISLVRRLESIRKQVEDRTAPGPDCKNKDSLFLKRATDGFGRMEQSWDEMGVQYKEYCRILATFRQFASPYFIFMYLTLIVSTVCMTYYVHQDNLTAATAGFAMDTVVWISCGRISDLGDCGYLIQRSYNSLVKAVMTLYQEDRYKGEEERQFQKFVELVTETELSLCAAGYFTVNRQNFTSILGVIITYTVILFQFHISDKSSTSPPTVTS